MLHAMVSLCSHLAFFLRGYHTSNTFESLMTTICTFMSRNQVFNSKSILLQLKKIVDYRDKNQKQRTLADNLATKQNHEIDSKTDGLETSSHTLFFLSDANTSMLHHVLSVRYYAAHHHVSTSYAKGPHSNIKRN